MKYTLMDFKLTEDYESRVRRYLIDGVNNGTILRIGNDFFDIKSLTIPTNLDCLNCEKVCDINCCRGTPYPPQSESLEFIKENYNEIFSDENAGDLEDRKKLKELLIDRNLTVLFGNRRWQAGAIKKTKGMETFPKVPDNGCVFNVTCEHGHKCAIHAHCLTKGINPISKKPIYCSLYPLCSIDLRDDSRFLFCILDPDITFGMWQNVDQSERPCFNKGLLTDPDRPYFKDEDYKSAFESSINSVKYLYGEELSNQVLEHIKNIES